MDDLKVIRTFTKGNIDENEIVEVDIYTHSEIDDVTIKMINKIKFYEAERYVRILKSKMLRVNND